MTAAEESREAELARLRAKVAELEELNAQLRHGLASRIVIEQAKGVLIERLDLPAEAVFELLRSAARRGRMKVHVVAGEILKTRVTPEYILREIQHLTDGNSGAWATKKRPGH